MITITATTMTTTDFPSPHRGEGQGEGVAPPLRQRTRQQHRPLFDSYLMVDWSAAAVPRRGPDSIWLCHLRTGRVHLENPETRLAARDRLADLLAAELAAGRSVLAGFDFPFGYPEGFAARLGGDWRGVWRLLGEWLVESHDNANNRFEVAARLNQHV